MKTTMKTTRSLPITISEDAKKLITEFCSELSCPITFVETDAIRAEQTTQDDLAPTPKELYIIVSGMLMGIDAVSKKIRDGLPRWDSDK